MRWVALFLLALGVAQAAPQVEIRARTQLNLMRVKRVDETTVEVSGFLRDKLTGQGIPGESVLLELGGQSKKVMTASDGGFTEVFTVASSSGPVNVSMKYRPVGGDRLDEADPLTVTTDPSKTQVDMKLDAQDDPSGARITLETQIEGMEAHLPIQLDVTPIGGDTWKKLRTVTSGEPFILLRKDVGGAGNYRLRAQFAGDDTRQAALALTTLELTSGSETSMKVNATKLAFEDDLVVTGKVTDSDGKPLAKAAVTLLSGDRRLAQGTTSDSGAYKFEIEAEVIAQTPRPSETSSPGTRSTSRPSTEVGGQYGIQVQADPGVSYIKGSRSEPAVIRILAPQPVPVSYTIIAFIATLAAAGGFFLARRQPWKKLRRPQKPAEVPSEEGEIVPLQGGLIVAKPGVVATLRRPSDDGFSGVVRDTVRGRPVEGAVVTLMLGDNERTVIAGADGSFAVDKLESGEWRASVAATGHIAEKFAVTIPHRGELRGVRIDLVPVRERVFQLYRRAAEPVLPDARLWGIWSPRQIVDHVKAKRPSPALAELTDFVEEVYFSPRLHEEAVLPQAEGRVTRALNERTAAVPRR